MALTPDDATLVAALAKVVGEQGRDAESEELFRRALLLDPQAAAIHAELALLLEKSERWAEAEVELRLAMQLAPERAFPRMQLAQLLESRGQGADAAELYSQAVEHDPSGAEAFFRRDLAHSPDDTSALVNLANIPRDRIAFGSTVTVFDTTKDEKIEYKLVTSEESDVNKGLISTTSPLRSTGA